MAKKYEHVDFTYLLDELQGNTALAVDESGPDIEIVEGTTDKITQDEDIMLYEDSLIVVSEMIQHVIRPYYMYLPHVETVLELFKALEGRSLTNTKKIEKMLGLHDKKKRSRSHLTMQPIKPKDTPVFPPKAYEYVSKASTEAKAPDSVAVKSLKDRCLDFLRRTIFRDRIRKAKYISEDSMPENNEICLYLWVDEQGNAHWSSGIYISATKEFAVSYR